MVDRTLTNKQIYKGQNPVRFQVRVLSLGIKDLNFALGEGCKISLILTHRTVSSTMLKADMLLLLFL